MPTKIDLEKENSRLKALLEQTSKILATNISRLFKDIQSEKPSSEIIKEEIKQNPFIAKNIEPKVKSNSTKSKWTTLYNNLIRYAADENTPMKRRTLDYLEKKIPFSRKAISRQVYRLGYKWRNGKVTCA